MTTKAWGEWLSIKEELALEVKDIIAKGKLVPDDILNKIVSEKLVNDCKNGFILDGYPRTIDQSLFLNNLLNDKSLRLNYIFNIGLNFNLLEQRILNRSIKENRELEARYKPRNNYFYSQMMYWRYRFPAYLNKLFIMYLRITGQIRLAKISD